MNNSQLDQSNISEQPTHVVTQQENTDGTTSLSIAQVMPGGHQVTIGSLNQVRFFFIYFYKIHIYILIC